MSEEVLDLHMLADEWEVYFDALDDEDADEDEREEAREESQKYVDLCDELGISPAEPGTLRHYGDHYEPTLVHEDYFVQYAEQLAEDIGAISADATWPNDHIDWEAAADALKADYTTVDYNDETYYTRSA
jgi:hypothetical protein